MAWWTVSGKTCVAAYDAIGAASLADSYTDESGAGNNAAPGVAPTWTSGVGWTFNGSTQYLTTGITPTGVMTALARFSGAPACVNCPTLCSGNNGAGNAFQLTPGGTANPIWAWGTAFASVAGGYTSGVMAMAATACYYNGSFTVPNVGVFSGVGQALNVGARNNGGTPDRFFGGSIQAIAIYSDTLSAGEIATVTAAMQALAAPSGAPLLMQMMRLSHTGGML